jgi:hypothetical protein
MDNDELAAGACCEDQPDIIYKVKVLLTPLVLPVEVPG